MTLAHKDIASPVGTLRLVAAATAEVGGGWDAATRLHHGDEVVTEGSFILKSEMVRQHPQLP